MAASIFSSPPSGGVSRLRQKAVLYSGQSRVLQSAEGVKVFTRYLHGASESSLLFAMAGHQNQK
ncbi:hypothetical protein KGM_211689 [Danaus plexippus plexippus]|uniref:Uncharacterized protein n=1 Tax=Danaus plexippus plexippus TaxID=278856 RepID=A0A212F492_DANPL|nr:hypothetical protein KGM_211689 [Danaus plexippus plexippus]